MKNWTNKIDNITEEFLKNFGALTDDEINWKPDAETWSIAQNIDHLLVINNTYFETIDALKAGEYQLPFVGKIGLLVNFFGKIVLKGVQPDRKKKVRTFPIWEPNESRISPKILEQFAAQQTTLKQEIALSGHLMAAGAIISSPANKNIVFLLETAFDIIISHEQRHLEQSKEALALLKKNHSLI